MTPHAAIRTPHLPSAGRTVVVGLGRTGMSCVRYLSARGAEFAVTDSRGAPPELPALNALATLTLANNLLGLAPGPFVTGALADRVGLLGAFQLIPLISLAATAMLLFARRHYLADLQRTRAIPSCRNGVSLPQSPRSA